jgi:hypothetical protein
MAAVRGPSRSRFMNIAVVALGLVVLATSALAQRNAQRAGATQHVDVALKAGSRAYSASGPGECRTSREASIHGVPATLYSVSQGSGADSVRFTLWQPKSGAADMVTLHVSIGGKRYEIDTVKGGAGREPKGSGGVRFEGAGAGGAFAVDAKAGDGTAITGSVKCSRFAAVVAEGG